MLISKKGQSLIEVVVIMGIVILAAIALISTTLFTQKTSRTADSQVQATKLVEQGFEQLRVIRDRKGLANLGLGSCKILNSQIEDPSQWSTQCSMGPPPLSESIVLNNTTYTRNIFITDEVVSGELNKKKVTLSVSWDDSGGTKLISSVTFFSDF